MSHVADGEQSPARKSSGVTPAERYLGALCEKSFLKFWSHPRPFRDQGGGKELCDLLVVMGDDVIVFSDKHCVLEPKSKLEVDWQRWFRNAVKGGAVQAWGAERWLRDHSDRIFADEECIRQLPVKVPSPGSARYHLVVTVHGVSGACKMMLGGTGSLMMDTNLQGLAKHDRPFVIGDLDPKKSFVHVFDDTTLDIIMSTLDTAPDFLRYLRAKEVLLRSRSMNIAGEENLLAHYLTNVDENEHHTFRFPESDLIALDESWWTDFAGSSERRSQIEHDKVSYFWDDLIGRFTGNALDGTQQFQSDSSIEKSETILRFMASEARLHRRFLSKAFLNAVNTTPPNQRRIRVIPQQRGNDAMYVFLMLPWVGKESEDTNRSLRRYMAELCMYVAKLKYPDADDIICIATESGNDHSRRSEDALYFDARNWNSEYEAEALAAQKEHSILVAPTQSVTHLDEYPASNQGACSPVKLGRNDPCHCGSGLKYKRCHGT